MLKSIKIKNFRSIDDLEINFWKNTTIIWPNWAWKTNVLQAILLLFQDDNTFKKIDNIIKSGESYMYLLWEFESMWFDNQIVFSIDLEKNKKILEINNKKLPKKEISKIIPRFVYFSPLEMNLFYLWPSYRRDFIDNILSNIYLEYKQTLKKYKQTLNHRNKLLKNISIWKSSKWEINFWDKSLVALSVIIYKYRWLFNEFIWENIKTENDFLSDSSLSLEYKYTTKTNLNDIANNMMKYLKENIDRDIIIWRTHIGPHLDDFNVYINWTEIINFGSRWEIKSIILTLKKIQAFYIKKSLDIVPILLIDDLESELDFEHISLLFEKFKGFQIINTSINKIDGIDTKNLNIN